MAWVIVPQPEDASKPVKRVFGWKGRWHGKDIIMPRLIVRATTELVLASFFSISLINLPSAVGAEIGRPPSCNPTYDNCLRQAALNRSLCNARCNVYQDPLKKQQCQNICGGTYRQDIIACGFSFCHPIPIPQPAPAPLPPHQIYPSPRVVDIQYSETGHLNGRGAESFSFTAPRDGTFSVSLSSLQSYLDVDFFQIGRSRKHAAS